MPRFSDQQEFENLFTLRRTPVKFFTTNGDSYLCTKYKDAAIDAGSSVSALRDWTYYDLEKAPDEIKSLVERYLARDYHNPLVEAEVKGVRFDFLKCLDMYHSKELDEQVRQLVVMTCSPELVRR